MNLRHAWQSLPPIKRHWLTNIMWGVLIEICLIMAHHNEVKWLENAQNTALDFVMGFKATWATKGKDDPKLIFVDVNEETWRNPSWGGGEPDRAPGDRIVQMIDVAFKKGAKQVVLDIVTDRDKELSIQLERLLLTPDFNEEKRLILVRTIRKPLPPPINASTGYAPELRTSVLDLVIGNSDGRIAIAAPYYKISEKDYIVRDWFLWRVACRPLSPSQGEWQIVPSVQLLATVYWNRWKLDKAPWLQKSGLVCPLSGGKPEQFSDMNSQVSKLDVAMWKWLEDIKLKGVDAGKQSHGHAGFSNRIVFRFNGAQDINDMKVPLASVVPALDIVKHDDSPTASTALKHIDFKGAIVVIGQSFEEAHDRLRTPLGEMSGSLVILNSIESMIRHGLLQEPGEITKLLLALGLIVIVGYVYARWNSLTGTVIATSVVLIALLFASVHLFNYGIWLDFALPLVGIQIHKFIKGYEEHVEHKRLAKLHGSSH